MDVLHRCCAGLDVHKRTVVACVRRVDPAGTVSKLIKTFATMTADLLALSDWLAVQGVTVVAMAEQFCLRCKKGESGGRPGFT